MNINTRQKAYTNREIKAVMVVLYCASIYMLLILSILRETIARWGFMASQDQIRSLTEVVFEKAAKAYVMYLCMVYIRYLVRTYVRYGEI